ncbi:MAG TPA: DUF547 domain-containing protein [Kiritimatiellia bacterium]|nr:DUF547 domain-containing protein [Kiritimatiellia bacterium]
MAVAICVLTFVGSLRAEESPDARYAALLSAHVRDGLVDYRGLAANREALDACIAGYAAVTAREFDGWTVPARLAYLVNVYNLAVLKIAVDDYPLSSIRKAGGWFSGDPFDWPSVSLFGHRISLNILLRNYIRRDYREAGVHLALCQGARASPPLRGEPYRGDRFFDQIADQARVFLASAPYNRIDTERKRMHLSPVFKWYAPDFVRQSGSVEAYVRVIVPVEWGVRDVPGRFSVRHTDFDWRLNDAAPRKK